MGLEPRPELSVAPRPAVYTGPGWNLLQRIAFRFCLAYLVLYILPFPIPNAVSLVLGVRGVFVEDEFPPAPDAEPPFLVKYLAEPVNKYVTKPYADFWDEVVLWTGRRVFDKEIEYRQGGSGDTTWNYVQVFVFAVLSVGLALLWTLAAWVWWRVARRSRLGYPHLHEWLRVFVRFNLAATMVSYGSVKVIKLQFGYPGPTTLLHTYGESSPMHLLWTFMGASDWYTWFTGAGEVLAGVLLCTRRTTLLGSLVAFGVMVHVIALNFCYDVPVKLFSSHLALMAVFLMAPDLPWMARVFLLGKPATPRGYTPLVRAKWLDWMLFVLRSVIVLTHLGVVFYNNHEASKVRGRLAPEPPLYGLWEVEEFSLDGKDRPPLTTDPVRWQRVFVQRGFRITKHQPASSTFMVHNMQGKPAFFAQVVVDTEARTITLTRAGGPPGGGAPPQVNVLRYTEPEERVIVVEGDLPMYADGKFGPKKLRVKLRHYGPDQFLLSSRGFHWINEMPYNQFGLRTEEPPKIMPPPKRP